MRAKGWQRFLRDIKGFYPPPPVGLHLFIAILRKSQWDSPYLEKNLGVFTKFWVQIFFASANGFDQPSPLPKLIVMSIAVFFKLTQQ
jgi:hypothetical protein